MKLALLLCFAACAVAMDPATLLALAAKAKLAEEVAGGVGEIMQNLGNILKNDKEDLADKTTAHTANVDTYLDIVRKIKSGELQVSKRDLIPERDVLVERIGRLYDRIRATVNGGFAFGQDALKEALDQLSVTYNRVKNLGSLRWVKRWINDAVTKIEEKLNEYERAGKVTEEKREVLPPHDEVVAKMEDLYDRMRILVNGKADYVLEGYKALLDQARSTYEQVERFKSLDWLKKWISSILDRLDAKLQEYAESAAVHEKMEDAEEEINRRDVLPPADELLARLERLYNRVRAYVNSGSDTAKDAYKESLDYLRYLIGRFNKIVSLDWMKKWLTLFIERAEKRLDAYDAEVAAGDVTVSRRELIPPKDFVLERIANLYERLRTFVNRKSDSAINTYKDTLDDIRKVYDRVQDFTSLEWLRSWIITGLNTIDRKLDQWELELEGTKFTLGDGSAAKLQARVDDLIERANTRRGEDDSADFWDSLSYLQGVLKEYIRVAPTETKYVNNRRFEYVEEFLDKLEQEQSSYETKDVSRRDVIPSKQELTARLARLYERVRAYVNSGADTALEAYKAALDYIRYLLERFEKIRSFEWMKKWIVVLLDRAEKNLNDYESRRGSDADSDIDSDTESNIISIREVLPPKDELLTKIGEIYDKLRPIINTSADKTVAALDRLLYEINGLYNRMKNTDKFIWLRGAIEKTVDDIQTKVDALVDHLESSHEEVRRDVTSALEAEYGSRTARDVADKIADFFKNKWSKVNQTFTNFAEKSKSSWKELIDEVKPIIERVQNRGAQLMDDTKQAAMLVRKSATETIDSTIANMLKTANKAVQDGKHVVDLLKKQLEDMAKEL